MDAIYKIVHVALGSNHYLRREGIVGWGSDSSAFHLLCNVMRRRAHDSHLNKKRMDGFWVGMIMSGEGAGRLWSRRFGREGAYLKKEPIGLGMGFSPP